MYTMTQAKTWAILREFWLNQANEIQPELRRVIKHWIMLVFPTYVPDSRVGGDHNTVMFADDSEIHYDWDNGDFECEGIRYSYPFNEDDPLWWEKELDMEFINNPPKMDLQWLLENHPTNV